ncbi:MAG TPA: dethiobiotin synthase [Allocoleopsis sp.]
MKALLITGTDTNSGKTVFTTTLAAYWLKYNQQQSLGIFKPIQSGPGDREFYQEVFNLNLSLDEINPLYLKAPLAPPIAAEKEGVIIDLSKVWHSFNLLCKKRDFVLVETLGGLGSPITYEITVADLAKDWKLPTVLVANVKLGAIAQIVANVALARYNKVNLIAIVLNCTQDYSPSEISDLTPVDLIQSLTNIPVLGCIPYIQDLKNLDHLAEIAANMDLEILSVNSK